MTKLEGLKELKKLHCSNKDIDCTKCGLNPFCAYYKFVYIFEQQETPKKPIKEIISDPYDYDEQGVNKNKIRKCPNCNFKLLDEYECIDYTFDYCPNCSQKIDWSVNNENI